MFCKVKGEIEAVKPNQPPRTWSVGLSVPPFTEITGEDYSSNRRRWNETGIDHDRSAVLVPRDAAAAGSCRRDLSSPRAAEDSAGDEPGRDASPAGCHLEPQGPRGTQPQLWWWPARQRGGPVEGEAARYTHVATSIIREVMSP